MSRWENEDLSSLGLSEEPITKTETYIAINGQVTEDAKLAIAKIQNIGNKQIFYVKFGRGEIFDPHGIDKNKASTFPFRKVKQTIFDNYKEYLATQRDVFLTRARREIKEGL